MILDQAEVILIHTNTQQSQKRHKFTILPTTTFDQFQDQVKIMYKVKENQIDLIIQQSNREIALNEYNFQAYKQTVHINKRIRVKEYDILSLTYIAPLLQKQEKIQQEIKIDPSDLQPILVQKGLYDYSSFFADDFTTLIPFLQTICPLKSKIQYSEQEQLSLRFIQHISYSIRPAIEDFCTNPDNVNKLTNEQMNE